MAIEEKAPNYKRRKDIELLRAQMFNERSSFLSHWKTLGDYILPRRPRFDSTDVNRGDRRNTNIIDSTATLAARTLRSGMMGGVTSPARPWFRLTTPDPDLAEFGEVKTWLHQVSQQMSAVFLKSNIYNSLPIIYGDMGVFATGALFIEEDFDKVIHSWPMPIGSYAIATDGRGRVNVFTRDFQMTVRQLVQTFGKKNDSGEIVWDNFSNTVKSLWDNHNLEARVDVVHMIEPNPNYDPSKLGSEFKRFYSCYYEKGNCSEKEAFLRKSGYDFFPVLCPRWEVTGEDVWGTTCPGMEALGDVKALQIMHRRKAQASEKMVNPPLQGPASLKNQKVSILPGDLTTWDGREGMNGLKPIHEVHLDLAPILNDIREHQHRIQRAFYEDMFLMLANSDRRQITAREIDERYEEKMLALGPVLEQLNQDLLNPLIDNTFDIMNRQGLIPPPPEDLQGSDLKVEYISVMAQAQKLIAVGGMERFSGFVGNLVSQTQNPELLDKVDFDQAIDEYGDATGVPPRIIRSDDQVAEIREGRKRQQEQARAAEIAKTMTSGAKDLSQIDMQADSALTRLIKQANAGNLVPQE